MYPGQLQQLRLVPAARIPHGKPVLRGREQWRVIGRVAYRDRGGKGRPEVPGAFEDRANTGALVGAPRYGDPPAGVRGLEAIVVQGIEETLRARS